MLIWNQKLHAAPHQDKLAQSAAAGQFPYPQPDLESLHPPDVTTEQSLSEQNHIKAALAKCRAPREKSGSILG